MSGSEVYVSDSSGALLGAGPITTATTAQATARLSLVGDIQIGLPATDPANAILTPATRPWIRIYGERELSVQSIGYGQIRSTDLSVDGREERTYTGPDQLGLLNNRTVGRLKLNDGSGGPQPAATVLASILAFVTGWTAVGVPSAPLYQEFSGETLFGALVKVANQLGDVFYLSGPKQITWLPKTTPYVVTGLTARSDVDPVDVESNPLVILIDGEVTLTEDYQDAATRLYPEGSGNRNAAINLLKCTRFGAPGTGVTGDYTSGDYTLHIQSGAGELCYIRYNPAEPTTDDIVEIRKDYKDITAQGTGTGTDAISAPNALFDAAYADLQKIIVPAKTYRFRVARCATDITVGTTIVLDIHRYVQVMDDTAYYTYADILDTCLMTEITREVDEAGQVQISSLTVTPNNRPIHGTTMNTLATVVGQMQDLTRHFQKAESALYADTSAVATGTSLTAGSVPFIGAAGVLTEDNTNFAFDDTNNRLGIGTNAPASPVDINTLDAGTTTQVVGLLTRHRSSGTPGVLFGNIWRMQAETSTNANANQFGITSTWQTATNGSQKARAQFNVYDTTAREAIRIEASGTAAMVGFYGVAAVVRAAAYTQTYATAARTVPAYTTDTESVAYTGAADAEAKLVDLNNLRVAYENIRASHDALLQVVNSLIDDLQILGLVS